MKIEVAVGQIKPRKGEYASNLRRLGELFEQIEADAPETQVLVLPETVLTGYFLEGGVRELALTRTQLFDDLLKLYREHVTRFDAALDICLGFYELGDGKYYNSALYATLTSEIAEADLDLPKAGILHVHRKFFLPTYGVFDEKRFVSRGRTVDAFHTRFGTVAVLICEDVWHSISATLAALQGAQVVYVVSASPGRDFGGTHVGNVARWNVLLPGIADEHNVWVVYAGLVGFEGGKGFTGSSQVIDPWGNVLVLGSSLDECLLRATVEMDDVATARAASPLLADLEAALGDVTIQLEQIARNPHRA
ncbi:MAG: putative amidohydrolase [Chthonomonadaceae bacterium]|nr:putative amidohydrolase [Chthonomonadaceae bacterium]